MISVYFAYAAHPLFTALSADEEMRVKWPTAAERLAVRDTIEWPYDESVFVESYTVAAMSELHIAQHRGGRELPEKDRLVVRLFYVRRHRHTARGHCLGRRLAAVVAIPPRVVRQDGERGQVGQLEDRRRRLVYCDAFLLRVHGQESSCDQIVLCCTGCLVVRRGRREVLCLCPRAALLLRVKGSLFLLRMRTRTGSARTSLFWRSAAQLTQLASSPHYPRCCPSATLRHRCR
jgi:hypothetical protein